MTMINSILLTGWFQLIVFSLIFFAYSSRVLRAQLSKGYLLGWLVGLFFIFAYAALNPPQSFRFGSYDGELNFIQVLMSSGFGVFVGILMISAAYLFRDNRIQKSLNAATITAMLVIAIFLQIIAEPDLRLMISLFMLTFGAALLAANIMLSRRYDDNNQYDAQASVDYEPQANVEQQPVSRLDSVRQRIKNRISMNNVPTNHPNTPQNS